MSAPTPSSADPILALREEFRAHLEAFYAGLKLAPPYESVEKGIRVLTTTLHAMPAHQQMQIAADPVLKWNQFAQAFRTSGLSKKHRGIIAGLARNRNSLDLPVQYDQFLAQFMA
ncbi:MAG TPA: hypothetical protein VIU63_02710 [Nitrospira sp.]